MATITLRTDDSTRDELERLARAREATVSDLLRGAIDDLLGRRRELALDQAPRSVGVVERRTLVLLHQVLHHLDPEGHVGDHRRQIELLEEGFTDEYGSEFAGIRPELALSECALVHDILEMFTILEHSLGKLDEQARAGLGEHSSFAFEFRGFDLSDPRESRLLSYAEHLITTKRWTTLADRFDSEHDHGNSHAKLLPHYQRMLSAYRTVVARRQITHPLSPEAYSFTAGDLREVLDVALPGRSG